jgi:hypothetical protein
MTELHTVVTDTLMGTLAAALGVALLLQPGPLLLQPGPPSRSLPTRLWAAAFLGFAVAALSGAAWHGFHVALGPRVSFWIWKVTVYAIGLFGLSAVTGSILASTEGRARAALLALMGTISAVYFVHMATHREFVYVLAFQAAAMTLLFSIHAHGAWKARDAASPWMIAGVLVSTLGAAAQAARLSPHPSFDHNDLFHVVQMVGSYLFFRGARLLPVQIDPTLAISRRRVTRGQPARPGAS